MNNVEFEKLLSARPKLSNSNTAEPCLRDLIWSYYKNNINEEIADKWTKEYTNELYLQLVNRRGIK